MRWNTVKLGDVCKIVSGATPKTSNPAFWGGDVPWITPKDLSGYEQKYINDTSRKITNAGLKSCSANILPPYSVLFSSRAPIGLIAINSIPVCTNQGFKSMVPCNHCLSPDYLYWWLKTHRDSIQQKGRGATFKEVSKKIVEDLLIPLPPLVEQKRIAEILDAADALRSKCRESLALLNTLLQSTFLDMFGNPVTNPMGWKMGVIGDLLKSATYGTSKKADPENGLYPILRMNNITYSGDWDFSDLKYIDLDAKDLPKYLVHRDEILFNRTNSKELVGKTAVFRRNEPMAFAGYLIKAIVNKSADPEYISAFMNTPQTKTFLRNKCKSIVGMANINAKEFQKIPIPKPPIDLQCHFAAIVKSIEHQKTRMRSHLTELDKLFASLQQRAFNGEL